MSTQGSTKIGIATATIIGMNAMIGSGIFTAPAAIASNVGPAGIVAYAFVVVSVWCMALSLARLAALYPQEGSFYTYAKQWGGNTVGLIASILYLLGLVVAMGLLAQVAGNYMASLVPTWSATTLGALVLGALVVLNLFGVALSELGQHILIVCTLFPLLAITAMCLYKAQLSNLTPFAPYGLGNILKATRIVIFGFFGFECAASLFAVVKDPTKNVPKAVTYSILIVGAIYLLFIASLILSTPLSLFTGTHVPLSETLTHVFPNNTWIVTIIHISILSAIIGTIHSMIWSSSALLLSLAPKVKASLATVIANNQSAAHKASVLALATGITVTFGSINNINAFFNLTAIGIVSAYILSMITLLTRTEEWRNRRNIITVLGIATALAILYFAVEDLIYAFLG